MVTLEELIRIANNAYPDDMIIQQLETGDVGDKLAAFIVSELRDTYEQTASDPEKTREAVRALNVAVDELTAVRDAVWSVHARRFNEYLDL